MNLKIGILAAAAALTLAIPAAALAQPVYGHGPYGAAPAYVRQDVRQDEWRRFDRERDWRRAEELRRLRWEESRFRHDHDFGRGYGDRYDRGYGYR